MFEKKTSTYAVTILIRRIECVIIKILNNGVQ